MSATATQNQPAAPEINTQPTPQSDPIALILKVAWMAIVLGFVMQILASAAAWIGGKEPQLKEFLAEGAAKISWSTIVCVGLALGTAASKMRTESTGLAGFLAAPAGFIAARTTQKSTSQAFGMTAPAAIATGIFVTILLLKAAEYASLGALLARLGEKPKATLGSFLGVGLMIGLLFGTVILLVFYYGGVQAGKPMPTPRLLAQAVNEIVFPIGCSFVIYASGAFAKRFANA
ncbi:MAG: hypothetical protein SF069_16990 [Phycisphaerae bacterium]|nr:hypothetical protein [Phycisphaerae bacterium]